MEPLTTDVQYDTLKSWSFIHFYQRNRKPLADAARRIYRTIERHSGGSRPRPEAVAVGLEKAMPGINIFKKICAIKMREGANPSLRGVFATALARYVVDNDWLTIALVKP